MEYTMEELVPVVGKLAEKYTAYESTSITCEKAEQLMGAVLYCIRELEQTGRDRLAPGNRLPAQRAYEIGAVCVEEKRKKHWTYIIRFCRNFLITETTVCVIRL